MPLRARCPLWTHGEWLAIGEIGPSGEPRASAQIGPKSSPSPAFWRTVSSMQRDRTLARFRAGAGALLGWLVALGGSLALDGCRTFEHSQAHDEAPRAPEPGEARASAVPRARVAQTPKTARVPDAARGQGARAPACAPTDARRSARSTSAAAAQPLGVEDRGIFDDLTQRVTLTLPEELTAARAQFVFDAAHHVLVLYEGAWPIKVYPVRQHAARVLELGGRRVGLRAGDALEIEPLLAAERMVQTSPFATEHAADRDGDGIPDPLDVLIGAHKTVLNAARYDGRYVPIAYPRGDVPRDIGVCTDVIVRALRNAGFDLQQALHEDIALAPQAYPMVDKPNSSIDHRRVKSVLPYFERHFEQHTAKLDDPRDPLRPGDIVFMDTFPDRPGAEHVGIVSEQRADSGWPLIINNWTVGTVTAAMALLPAVPITERFRLPSCVAGQGPIAAAVTQLVVVTSPTWDDWHAQLQRYARERDKSFHAVGPAMPVVLGRAGYAWGDGLHGGGAPGNRAGPLKREGDGRSPAGVFALGTVHGYAPRPPAGLTLPYEQASPRLRCVDDPRAAQYNRVVEPGPEGETWSSAERMRRDDAIYELALDIEHNRAPVVPGHGSCIFAHAWASPQTPVAGCTGMAPAELRSLLTWLKPGAVWVALPQQEYEALRGCWNLPDSPNRG